MSISYIAELINTVIDKLMSSAADEDENQDEFTKMMNLKRRSTLESQKRLSVKYARISVQIIESQFGNQDISQNFRSEEQKYLEAMSKAYDNDSDEVNENEAIEKQIIDDFDSLQGEIKNNDDENCAIRIVDFDPEEDAENQWNQKM